MTESPGLDAVMKDGSIIRTYMVGEGAPDLENVFARAPFHPEETALMEMSTSGIR